MQDILSIIILRLITMSIKYEEANENTKKGTGHFMNFGNCVVATGDRVRNKD